LPDERTVVLSCVVVLVGAGAFLIVVDVVVVVVGAGFSTTVVHEVNSAVATARSGVTIISFFIVGVVPSKTIRRRFLCQMYFWPRFCNYLGGGSCAPPRDAEKWRRSRD
jgi:hypothetical protein